VSDPRIILLEYSNSLPVALQLLGCISEAGTASEVSTTPKTETQKTRLKSEPGVEKIKSEPGLAQDGRAKREWLEDSVDDDEISKLEVSPRS
jgi:hypothetical protein